jgi:Flp pilus assembly pilin Flp
VSLLNRLWTEEEGQGLVEYTLVVLLVALIFWMGIRNTNVGDSLAQGWSRVMSCVTSPSSCST